jgi:hypothetical protein
MWSSTAQFKYRMPRQNETVLILSHPLGQGKRLSVGQCKVLIVDPPPASRFVHNCAVLEGSSGALLFAKSDGAILGMHIRGEAQSGTAVNIVTIVARSKELSTRANRVGEPNDLDVTGWPLTEMDFLNQLQSALRSKSAAFVFDAILNETTAYQRGIGGLSLYRVSVRAGSVAGLAYLRSRGITLPPADRRASVHEAIEAIDEGAPIEIS